MGSAKKALPKLGQTQDVMRAFVETGKTEATNTPRQEPRQEPRHKPMHDDAQNAAVARLCSIVEERRSATRERIVQRGYAMPESVAVRIRRAAAAEGVTATEIIVEAAKAWLDEYERRFSRDGQ